MFIVTELILLLFTIADLKLSNPDTLFITKCWDDDEVVDKVIPLVPVEFITLLTFCVPFIVNKCPFNSPRFTSIVCVPLKEYSLSRSSELTASGKELKFITSAKTGIWNKKSIKKQNTILLKFIFTP